MSDADAETITKGLLDHYDYLTQGLSVLRPHGQEGLAGRRRRSNWRAGAKKAYKDAGVE